MKFNIDQLRHLSEETVDRIMADPHFYQQHFSVKQFLPQVKLKHYAESLVASDVVQQSIATGEMEQLSLLDELMGKSGS